MVTSRKSPKTLLKERYYHLIDQKQSDLKTLNKSLIKMDLHCHDLNSDKPDELWGRILNLRETWIPSNHLKNILYANGAHAITITNHNNCLSCWQLMEEGHDVLAGAEFTCFFKEYDLYLHVLCYGLTPEHEDKLNKIRHNIFKFLEYTAVNNLPTILPHPLYFYSRVKSPPIEAFEKLSLMFERFECLNGQRNIWQNSLAAKWINDLTPERLEFLSKKHGIKTNEFCRNPYKKSLSGGSDDHLAIYAGSCGTMLAIDSDVNLPLSQLALNAIRNGDMAPYGKVADGDRLGLTFLDYFCQVVLNMEDPGMMRILLHQGSWKDKLSCSLLGNLFLELQKNKGTRHLLQTIHNALHGKKPGILTRVLAPSPIKRTIKQLGDVAHSRHSEKNSYEDKANKLMMDTFKELSMILADNFENSLIKNINEGFSIDNFDFPLQLRQAVQSQPQIKEIGLSSLLTLILSAAKIAGSRALYSGRDFLNMFADAMGQENIDHRLLFFVEDFFERSPRGRLFREMHFLCIQEKLPIDFITCTDDKTEVPGLIKISPVKSIKVNEQSPTLHIPDFFELHDFFRKSSYDQVLSCGSILPSLSCLFLKECFVVNAHIFVRRNWLKAMTRKFALNHKQESRLRRIIRFYYKQFSTLFTPNLSMTKQLCEKNMNLNKNNIIGLDLNSNTDSLASLHLIIHRLGLSSGKKKKFESTLFEDIYTLTFSEEAEVTLKS